jgi:hypothetical protein
MKGKASFYFGGAWGKLPAVAAFQSLGMEGAAYVKGAQYQLVQQLPLLKGNVSRALEDL